MTLQEHIDALDRMVTQGTSVPELRSQIAFIGRELAVIEADYARLAEACARLQKAHSELDAEHTALKDMKHKAGWDALVKKADDYQRMDESKNLNYEA